MTPPATPHRDDDAASPSPTPPTDSETLPVPAEDVREYIQITPTETPLCTDSVAAYFKRLHRLTTGQDDEGWLSRLRVADARTTPPTIECLLLSDHSRDQPLTYWFGVDNAETTPALERVLRGVFPDSYEFEHRAIQPGYLELLLKSSTDTGGTTDPPSLHAVEFEGVPTRTRDWQTQLTQFESFQDDEESRVPLASLVETMSSHEGPIIYQVLLQPKPDWTADAEERRMAIELHSDTLGERLANTVFGAPDPTGDPTLTPTEEERLSEIEGKDTRHSFVIAARLVGAAQENSTRDATSATIRELTGTFSPLDRTTYEVDGTASQGVGAERVLDDLLARRVYPPETSGLSVRLPWRSSPPRGIVADVHEAPSLCLVGGDALTTAGERVLATTPGERAPIPRPPVDQLVRYRDDGLLLGNPLTQDGSVDPSPISVPPSLQPMHVGWFGKTGSGKSTSLLNAILANHAATDGADILIDPKGDGMAIEYLQAHFATYGTLENVLYFDCSRVLPAFSFFDIRDDLAAGIPRETAVEDTIDHYLEILTQVMGKERFEQAVRSPDIIKYLLKARFDPVHGSDAFTHRAFQYEVQSMHERQSSPPVSDTDLERMLGGIVANRPKTFDNLMSGVANRIEKIPVDRRLGTIFNNIPQEGDPQFDLADHLDDNTVIILDTGGLRSEAKRVLTLLILSNLWSALKRRSQRTGGDEDDRQGDSPTGDDGDKTPLVNLYVEEAASVAVSDLLKELLSQSRSFGCSVTLAMQFPGQLKEYDDVYDEVLNNISTLVTGNVPVDRRLAERLATDVMDPQAVGNRLRALNRGEWFVRLPAPFDAPEPRPFLVRSAAPPAGHDAGSQPLSAADQSRFETQHDAVATRTRDQYGLVLESPSIVQQAKDEEPDEQIDSTAPRVDTALGQTKRMPETVEYDESIHALRCSECDNRYDPDIDGMRRAISCCGSLAETDRDDIPICELNLKITPEERQATAYTDTQLMFLQAVYNAQQLRYDPLAYDLCADSMLRLQEYVGIESEAIDDLIDGEVLRHDGDHPHRLYTVTPDGRSVIGESYRMGVDYGHGKGDLEESSQHVLGIEVSRRFLCQEYRDDLDSDVVEVTPYFDLDEVSLPASIYMGGDEEAVAEATEAFDKRRLDVAALDEEGNVVVAVEVERINHDIHRAVPEDFDKIADCGVEEAIWVVMKQRDGHTVLSALNDPVEGEVRVEKTYSETTPPQQFRIDSPGMTAVYPVKWLRDTYVSE